MVINKIRLSALTAQEQDEAFLADISVIDRNVSYLSNTIEDFKNFFNPKVNKEWYTASNICEQLRSLANPILKCIKLIWI